MVSLIIWAVVIGYLICATRFVMPFAKESVKRQVKMMPYTYRDGPDAEVYRTAIWVGLGQSLFWLYVISYRWVTDRLVYNLTADERKAKELAEARRVIADYEREQRQKKLGDQFKRGYW